MTRKSIAAGAVAAVLLIATVSFVGLGAVGAQSTDDPAADRTIAVSATGEAAASPDQAVVRVSVTAQGNDSAAVRDDLASGAAQLRTALDELNVEYETTRYAIEEYDERRRPDGRESTAESTPAYRGVHSFTVTVDDTDSVGAVVDATASAGAGVNSVELTLSEERRTDLRDQAIENAMSDARSQATTLAAAGNLTVTEVASIEASQRRYSPVRYAAAADSGGAAPNTVIDSGEVSVSYDVQVTYNATA
jgi:uncharacterized protein YggE